jgi:transposase-like protein
MPETPQRTDRVKDTAPALELADDMHQKLTPGRAMQAELTHHLGYEKQNSAGQNSGNCHNGESKKALKGEFGNLPIAVLRDLNATFEPQIVPKGQILFKRRYRFASKCVTMK